MMKIRALTSAEEQLMMVIWNIDSGYMRDIIAAYPEPKPHPNTVSTFLKILVEKEFLNTTREGRIFHYSAAIPHVDYRQFLLEDLLLRHFENNAQILMGSLKKDGLIVTESAGPENRQRKVLTREPDSSKEEINALVAEITKKKKKKKDGQAKKKKKKK